MSGNVDPATPFCGAATNSIVAGYSGIGLTPSMTSAIAWMLPLGIGPESLHITVPSCVPPFPGAIVTNPSTVGLGMDSLITMSVWSVSNVAETIVYVPLLSAELKTSIEPVYELASPLTVKVLVPWLIAVIGKANVGIVDPVTPLPGPILTFVAI